MAKIEELKITSEKTKGKHVADLPTNPSESLIDAVTLQNQFDALPKLVIEALNTLIDYLVANGAGDKITAQTVGARPSTWMPTASDVGAFPYEDIISAGISLTDILNSGVHYGFYYVSGNNNAGTPYEEGITGVTSFFVFSMATSVNNGIQVAFPSGITNVKLFMRTKSGGTVGKWSTGFLPLDGSVPMSGTDLKLFNGFGRFFASDYTFMMEHTVECQDDTGRGIMLSNQQQKPNIAEALKLISFESGSSKTYNIYGEHNKPSGSYTGNGSATQRKIATGGIGGILIIVYNNYITFAYAQGAVSFNTTGSTVKGLASGECRYEHGILYLGTTHAGLNENGKTFAYYN